MGAGFFRIESSVFVYASLLALLGTAAFYALMMSIRQEIEPISLEPDWELDRELICNQQCDDAGYAPGSEEYMKCVSRCISGT